MARPLEFDRSLARDRALRMFWRRGYQGAGLSDLLATMQIGRSSLYAAFGDKRRLFLECLDLFASRSLDALSLEGPEASPVPVLRRFFEQSFLTPGAEERGWGCMLVNTVVELSDIDDDLRDQAAARLKSVQDRFAALLSLAGLETDPARAYAGYLMAVNQGLRVASRQGLAPEDLKARIAVTFDLLESALKSHSTEACRQ